MTSRFRAVLPCLLLCASPWPLRAAAAPVADTVVESQAFDSQSSDTQTVSIFTGNVTVTGNDIRITCDRLEVISLRSGGQEEIIGKQERFKSLVATGRVRIVQGDREATCEHAGPLPTRAHAHLYPATTRHIARNRRRDRRAASPFFSRRPQQFGHGRCLRASLSIY